MENSETTWFCVNGLPTTWQQPYSSRSSCGRELQKESQGEGKRCVVDTESAVDLQARALHHMASFYQSRTSIRGVCVHNKICDLLVYDPFGEVSASDHC
jgi:hypothetical protein